MAASAVQPSSTRVAAVLAAWPEKNSESRMIEPNSPSVALAVTSCPRSEPNSPAS